MTWSITPHRVKAPELVDTLMLALGKSLYLACEFERKCQYVLRLLDFVENSQQLEQFDAVLEITNVARDRLLGPTIDGVARISNVTNADIEILTKGRIARNYVAHDSGKIGQFHRLGHARVAEVLAALRPAVVDLARGDNLVSRWQFEFEEKHRPQWWMTANYEAKVIRWVFDEGVERRDVTETA